jgi:hypothetical protein
VFVGAATAIAVLLYFAPLLWWRTGARHIGAGGGTVEGDPWTNFATLLDQLTVSGDSYYYFGDQPGLGSVWLAAAVVAAGLVLPAARTGALPWLTVAVVTVAMWLPAGNMPGLRRAVAIPVVAAIVLGATVDVLWRRRPGSTSALVLGMACAAVVLPLVDTLASWQQAYHSGRDALVADFTIDAGPMSATFARFHADLAAGRETAETMVARHDGIRTLAVVWRLADESGDTAGIPDPEEIVRACLPAP